jgi:hypothetical protein
MNRPISRPEVSAPIELTPSGLNQSSDGWIAPEGASPSQTRASATRAKAASAAISAVRSQRCVFALTSMPMTQTTVMIAIHATPTPVTASVDGSMPNSMNEYRPAIWARFAITITSATTIAQPPIQPVFGPNARVAHANVVPASGSALLRYL